MGKIHGVIYLYECKTCSQSLFSMYPICVSFEESMPLHFTNLIPFTYGRYVTSLVEIVPQFLQVKNVKTDERTDGRRTKNDHKW